MQFSGNNKAKHHNSQNEIRFAVQTDKIMCKHTKKDWHFQMDFSDEDHWIKEVLIHTYSLQFLWQEVTESQFERETGSSIWVN